MSLLQAIGLILMAGAVVGAIVLLILLALGVADE